MQFTKICEVKEMQELLRVKNNLMRVIAENNHFMETKPLESVRAYNKQIERELVEINKMIGKQHD